jgi:hypothetical protein
MPSDSYGAEDHVEQMNRVHRLNKLYIEDGREDKNHPMHGLFTGLFQQSKSTKNT